jgi:hypothetical protein
MSPEYDLPRSFYIKLPSLHYDYPARNMDAWYLSDVGWVRTNNDGICASSPSRIIYPTRVVVTRSPARLYIIK